VTSQRSERTHADTEDEDERRDWWFELDDHGVTALDAGRAVAHAYVHEDGDRVQLILWMDERLPGEIGIGLTRRVFALPPLRPHRPVAVSLPHREVEVLTELRNRLIGAVTHAAGSTCLVVGRVR
jgi:hypothetical protein